MILLSSSLFFLSILIQIVSSSPTGGDTGVLHVPFRRRAPAGQPMDLATMADHVRMKYGFDPVHKNRTLQRRGTVTGVAISDEGPDISYLASLEIGTPPQSFDVILDTGSSDLWLASTACRQGCQGATTYDFSSSSTFNDQGSKTTVQYGSGEVIGELGTETLSMAGFTVQKQGFIVAEAVTQGLVGQGVSGLMGLAFQSLAQTGALPFVQGLVQNNQLSAPQMSFQLTRNINNGNPNAIVSGGILTLGGTNSSLFSGDIQFNNFPSGATPSFWLASVDALTIQGHTFNVPSSESLSAIDTGTTLIGVTSDAFNAVCSSIQGSQNGTGQLAGFCVIPCNTQINSAATFGGKSWSINPADFSVQQQDDSGQIVCVAATFDLTPNTGPTPGGPFNKRQQGNIVQPMFVFGDAFLKNVYTVFQFNPPAIGFAELSTKAGGSGTSAGTSANSGTSHKSSPSTQTMASPSAVTTSLISPSSVPTLSSPNSPSLTPPADSIPSSSSGSNNSAFSSRLHSTVLGTAFTAAILIFMTSAHSLL